MLFKSNGEAKWTIVISLLIALYVLLSLILFSKPWFQNSILDLLSQSNNKILLIFSFLCVLASLGLPRQIVAFTCGYFFDVVTAMFIATVIVTTAALITYRLSSLFKQTAIINKMKPKAEKLIAFLSSDTFLKSVIIRLLPVGSNFLTNIFAGVTQVPVTPFILGSAVGYIPQMFIFSLVGSGIKLGATDHLVISFALLVCATFLGWLLYKKSVLSK